MSLLRVIRRRAYRLLVWSVDVTAPLWHALLVVGAGLSVLLPSAWALSVEWEKVVWGAAPVLAAGVAAFYHQRKSRKDLVVVEIALGYLVRGGYPLIDRLFGRLISGRWRREEMRLGGALYEVINQLLKEGDYWKLRRLTEALPMLGSINPNRTVQIMQRLREHWHKEKWRSDLRRRTIEALLIRVRNQQMRLLDKFRQRDISNLLKLRQGDEVYTAFAAIEAIFALRRNELEDGRFIRWKKGNGAADDILAEARDFIAHEYSAEECKGLERLQNLLETAQDKRRDAHAILALLRQMIESSDIYTQIAAVRHIVLVSHGLESDTLDLIAHVAAQRSDENRNVRRPLARETCTSFLVSLIAKDGPYANKAKEIYWGLVLDDPDMIVRVTAFDMAEALEDDRPELLKELCQKVVDGEREEELRQRAEIVLAEVDAATAK
jgi:hypothetical protein